MIRPRQCSTMVLPEHSASRVRLSFFLFFWSLPWPVAVGTLAIAVSDISARFSDFMATRLSLMVAICLHTDQSFVNSDNVLSGPRSSSSSPQRSQMATQEKHHRGKHLLT